MLYLRTCGLFCLLLEETVLSVFIAGAPMHLEQGHTVNKLPSKSSTTVCSARSSGYDQVWSSATFVYVLDSVTIESPQSRAGNLWLRHF
jgi:hypothetical protein